VDAPAAKESNNGPLRRFTAVIGYARSSWQVLPQRSTQLSCVGLLLAVLLLPRPAGTGSELERRVDYLRLEPQRQAPALVAFDWPAAGLSIAPASLGHFTDASHFVYTGELPRGLLYGLRDGQPVILELSAQGREEDFLETHLELIRSQVAQLNKLENLLRLKRKEATAPADAGATLASALWEQLPADPAAPLPQAWLARALAPANGLGTRLPEELQAQAQSQIEQKRLFYEAQQVRIQLWLEQYDLQLELAGIPRARHSELLSLGDRGMVRDGLAAALERLQLAWDGREAQLNADQLLLQANLQQQELAQQLLQPLYAPPQSSADGHLSTPLPAPAGPSLLSTELTVQLAGLRLNVVQSELGLLRQCQQQLAAAHLRLAREEGNDDGKLLQLAAPAALFTALSPEQLPQYIAVQQQAATPGEALTMLLKLTRGFSDSVQSRPVEAGGSVLAQACARDEVGYALEVVDSCLAGSARNDQQWLLRHLQRVVEAPQEYDLAACDLSLPALAAWYGGLPLPAPAPGQAPASQPATPHQP
jgi:hypothetical protein